MAALLLAALLLPIGASGQTVGLSARYGIGTSTKSADPTMTLGMEGEVFIRPGLAAIARGDVYLFGFSCIGLGPCQN
jgi:hypothetical protein